MGSVHYVSPEQARGGYCDEKSDIYSAGITMYEMVTGRVPFDGDSTVSVAMKHLQENITPPSEYAPDLYPALEKIILKCTQKSAERRYQSAGELIQDLKRALVDPSGEFVDMVPIRSMGDTVMISPERMARMKKRQGDGYDDEENGTGFYAMIYKWYGKSSCLDAFAAYVGYIMYASAEEKAEIRSQSDNVLVNERLVKEYCKKHLNWDIPELGEK